MNAADQRCECWHARNDHWSGNGGPGPCQANVYTALPPNGGSISMCPCKSFKPAIVEPVVVCQTCGEEEYALCDGWHATDQLRHDLPAAEDCSRHHPFKPVVNPIADPQPTSVDGETR